MHADCILSGWQGSLPPLSAVYRSVINVVRTVFHDFELRREIVDVSVGGIVRFEAVWFSRVTLLHGHVVGTGLTDYTYVEASFGDTMYFPDDGEEFDVEVEEVAPGAGAPFGASAWIPEAVMSDCVFLLEPELMPGCPAAAIAAREALLQRAEAMAGPDWRSREADGPEEWAEYEGYGRVSGEDRLRERADEETPWFLLVKEVCSPEMHGPGPAPSCRGPGMRFVLGAQRPQVRASAGAAPPPVTACS